MKKIIMLIILGTGAVYGGDCKDSFALRPTPELPSIQLRSSTSQQSVTPNPLCRNGECPQLATMTSYAPLLEHDEDLQVILQRLRSIPNYQKYPLLSTAISNLGAAIGRSHNPGGY